MFLKHNTSPLYSRSSRLSNKLKLQLEEAKQEQDKKNNILSTSFEKRIKSKLKK